MNSPASDLVLRDMTPELHSLPAPLPARLRWTHAQRRTAWLFHDSTCIGSLGFGGYGRASGLTSLGLWHIHRLGVLQKGTHLTPGDGRHPPLLLRQPWALDGELDLPGGEVVTWRTLGTADGGWAFERGSDRARLLAFAMDDDIHGDIHVEVTPAATSLGDPTPLLLLGAFLVRLAVDDSVVIAGAV